MFVVVCLFTLFNGGIAGKLSTLDEATSHHLYNGNTTNENNLDAIAGVRAFTQEEKAEPRIVGGKEAWPHSWPWQVVLSFANMPACGGAILSQYWIVTAAHCFKRFALLWIFPILYVDWLRINKWVNLCVNGSLQWTGVQAHLKYVQESLWTVRAGKHDLENESESCQQDAKVAKIITHEDYNSVTKQHDIALLKLQTPLLFDECVRPIPVWNRDLPSLKRCAVTGWGSTTESGPRADRLQEANITILETDTCVKFYGGVLRSSMVCAGEVTGGLDACQGDSGGPLSCFTGKRYEIAGIVSWGVGCGRARKPGVYTGVAFYIPWINSIIDTQLGADGSWKELAASRKLFNPNEVAVKKCGQAELRPCSLDQGYVGFESSEPNGEPKVVNVTEACLHSWPWQVSLQSEDNHYCSGALLNERWVVTARHCRAEAGDLVVLGAHDLNSMESQHVSVKAVYSQAYDGSFPPLHDLALLYLGVPARLGPSVSPICIPSEELQFDQGSSCVTTGWGYKRSTPKLSPNVLYQTQVTLVPEQACWSGWGRVFSSNVLLCTQPAASSSCLGDTGAPLLCQDNGRYYLAGMMALGLRRCDPKKPAIFTSVSSFQSWIKNIMNNEGL